MSNEMTVLEPRNGSMAPAAQFGEMSVQAVVDRKRKILEVMKAVMHEGPTGHYGLIPGCGPKPTLFKAGAEVLATTFNLAPRFNVLQTDLPGGHREYRVTCTLTHIGTGSNCGEGVGSCSTMESKYRWRNDDAFEVTDERIPQDAKDKKAEYRKKGFGMKKVDEAWRWVRYTGAGAKVENPDIADQYNTVLKMAKKRAQIDATLTAVGASDLLTQDLEDLPAASVHVEVEPEAPAPRAPAARSTGKRVEVKQPPAPPPEDDLPTTAPADDNLYAPLPTDWDRAAVVRDLTEMGRTGSEVKNAAKELGFIGKAMTALTDAELCALDRRVWAANHANPI